MIFLQYTSFLDLKGWFVLCAIVFFWFVLAIYRVEKSNHEKIDEELGSKEDLNGLVDLFHQGDEEDKK